MYYSTGVVRDHRLSVANAIRFNYDAYYIRHPINCQLMLSIDNSRKYTTSSISYADLVMQVDQYESQRL